jgi:hypothetical protein
MRFYKDQKISPLKGSPPTPYTPHNHNNNQLLNTKILVVSLSAFIAARYTISPSLSRPIPAIITLTLMDLTNDPKYPISPSGSSADAFLNPSIQNTNFNKSEEEGQESSIF